MLVAGLGGIDIVTAVVRQIAELGFEKRGCSDLARVAVFIPHLRTFSLQLHSYFSGRLHSWSPTFCPLPSKAVLDPLLRNRRNISCRSRTGVMKGFKRTPQKKKNQSSFLRKITVQVLGCQTLFLRFAIKFQEKEDSVMLHVVRTAHNNVVSGKCTVLTLSDPSL